MVEGTIRFGWVGDGTGSQFIGPNQSNNPGFAATFAAGAVRLAQEGTIMIAEQVPGGDAPSLANFLTALTNLANDMAGTPTAGTVPVLSQGGAMNGDPRTPLAIIQSWATGNP
jgi:hypothetical protein